MFGSGIAMCCDKPMIWTFIFPGAEWFCSECKSSVGMMNATSVDETPELAAEKDRITKLFRAVAKDYIPPRSGRVGCKKCEIDRDYHVNHATDEELKKSEIAHKRILSPVSTWQVDEPASA